MCCSFVLSCRCYDSCIISVKAVKVESCGDDPFAEVSFRGPLSLSTPSRLTTTMTAVLCISASHKQAGHQQIELQPILHNLLLEESCVAH